MSAASSPQGSTAGTPTGRLPFLAKTFLRSTLLILLYSGLGLVALAAVASTYARTLSGHGAWSLLGGWSLTAVFAMAGLIGGALAGALTAATRTFAAFERALREWLERLPASLSESGPPKVSIEQLRTRYAATLDHWVTNTIGRFRLPGLLDRLLRSQLRQAILEDFVTDCERRGLATAGAQEFRGWLLVRGLDLAATPVREQLHWWRILIIGVMGLLAAGALILAYLNG